MKKYIALLLALSVSIGALAGCGENANAPAPSEWEVETSSDAPVEKTLEVVLASGGRTLDPSAATDGISAIFVNSAYDQLVTFGTVTVDGKEIANPEDIQPSLAKAWESTEDGLEYTFYLDERAKFANGDPVDADAVIFSLDRIKNSPTSSFLFALSNITEMEKVDDYTVKFSLSKPCAILYKLLQMHLLSIINPKQLEGIEDVAAYLTNETAGSGPYTINKWEASSEAILTARPDYWKGEAPVQNIHVQFVAEAANRVLLAEKGDVDIAMSIPPKDLPMLEGNENLSVNVYESNTVNYFAMNTQVAPFDNVLVRQAICYAIPYDNIIDDIIYGRAAKLKRVVPKAMPGHIEDPGEYYDYDLDKAKALLEEAGYGDGLSFSITLDSSSQDNLDTAVLIQAELAKIGVTANLNQMERAQYLEALKSGNIETAVALYTAFVNDPGYFFGNTLHSQGEYNYANNSNPEIDALWDEAESTNDNNLRMENYKKAQEIFYETAPWALLFEGTTIVVLNKSIESYRHYPDGSLRFYTINKK